MTPFKHFKGPSSRFVAAVNSSEPINLHLGSCCSPILTRHLSIQSEGEPVLFIEERRSHDFKGRAAREARPSGIKGMFLFFYPPPLNTRPCIIQITSYICTLSLKLEFGLDVFSMLAHQSGIYVRLKIHTILPLHPCLKSSLVVAARSLVWLEPRLLAQQMFSGKHICSCSWFEVDYQTNTALLVKEA